jgi:hypothetical protein
MENETVPAEPTIAPANICPMCGLPRWRFIHRCRPWSDAAISHRLKMPRDVQSPPPLWKLLAAGLSFMLLAAPLMIFGLAAWASLMCIGLALLFATIAVARALDHWS